MNLKAVNAPFEFLLKNAGSLSTAFRHEVSARHRTLRLVLLERSVDRNQITAIQNQLKSARRLVRVSCCKTIFSEDELR